MMEQQVKVPGVGKVKTTYVIAAGALVAGIVGYAWWTRRSAAASAPVYDVDSVGETDYRAPGASSNYTAPAPPEGTISTNVQWSNAALQWAQTHGYDEFTAAMAVAQYLSRKPLNTKEADFIQVVTAQIGPPPTGGPWMIIPEPAPDNTSPTLPDLSRFGDVTAGGGAPWRLITVREGETWGDVALRAYAHDKNFSRTASNYDDVVRFLADTNTQIKTPQPKAGDVVVLR